MKKKIIIILVIFIAAAIPTYFLLSRNKKYVPVWKTTTIEKGNIIVTVTATGTINPDTTVLVGAQVSGIVAQIFVDFDSVVRKGQIIARLDTTLEHATVVQAEAAVENAAAQLELQKKAFNRIDTLYHQNVEDKNDYDLAYARWSRRCQILKSAKSRITSMKK